MEAWLSHWGSGAGSDQGMECFIEVHWAGHPPNCVLALHSVRKRDRNAPEFEVAERRFSPLSQRRLFDGVQGPVTSEAEAKKAAPERSKPADHAMFLLKLEFLQNLHGLLGTITFEFFRM